jgi:ABC-type dipeptide/oligopeptide/nickel transport system permease subunit
MSHIPTITTALLLLLTAPAAGIAQQRVESDLSGDSKISLPIAVVPALWSQVSETAVGTLDSGPAIIASYASSGRLSRSLIGTGVGLLAGAAVGSVYGYHQYDVHEVDPLLSRPTETVLFGIMGGSAGGLLGALAGYLWPDQREQPASVSFAPSTRGSVAVSLVVQR